MSSLKIIIMGVGGVGKSAITCRYINGRWVEKYDPTVEESYSTTVDVDGKALQVDILDTAGQDEFSALRETFMPSGDGFMLVYSITDDQTLEDLKSFREQILRVHSDLAVPMIVVGNKLDLASDRAVMVEEGRHLANTFNAPFVEVSARENIGVREAFVMLIRAILARDPAAGKGENIAEVLGAGTADPTMELPVPRGQSEAQSAVNSNKQKSRCIIL